MPRTINSVDRLLAAKAMSINTLPVLYSFRRCPYAIRARLALEISDSPVELREVLLSDKPEQMLRASPKGTVPVLVLPDGEVIDESLAIMYWALEKLDPHQWLPADQETQARTQVLLEQCDGPFKLALDRYKYPTRYGDVDPQQHRETGARFLREWNQQLYDSPYLLGGHATLADMAMAPFIRQFAMTDRPWFDQQAWPELRNWLDAFVSGPLFKSVMVKTPRWQPEG